MKSEKIIMKGTGTPDETNGHWGKENLPLSAKALSLESSSEDRAAPIRDSLLCTLSDLLFSCK